MCASAPPSAFGRDLLAGHLLHDLRSRDEHLGLAGLNDEVGQGGRIGRTAGAGSANQRNLRHSSRKQHVGVKDLAVARQRVDAFLHAGPTGIVDEHKRTAGLQRAVHDVGNLERMDLAGRAAQDREVLTGQMNQPAIDRGRTRHHTIGRNFLICHAEIRLPVLGEEAELFETIGIHQRGDALAGRELALFLLLGQPFGSAALLQLFALLAETVDQAFHRFRGLCSHRVFFLSDADFTALYGARMNYAGSTVT